MIVILVTIEGLAIVSLRRIGCTEMLEDKLLVWKLKHGSKDALRHIYEKYKDDLDDLLALATALLNDAQKAEDVVHDVFVTFVEFASKRQIKTNLKGYLLTSIANRVRNLYAQQKLTDRLTALDVGVLASDAPDEMAMSAEQSRQLSDAIAELPYEQREVIILHLHSGLKFKAIAQSRCVSINTVQSRYRYGLNKLQSILNGEVTK
jgi:RNA polymerase sigma-70 factor (ECF subfamily)